MILARAELSLLKSSLSSVKPVQAYFIWVSRSYSPSDAKSLTEFQLGVFAGGMSSFIDDGSTKEEKEADSEEASAGIEIKFLGNKLRPFIFFNSMGELRSLYWSGASEEKTSALQV